MAADESGPLEWARFKDFQVENAELKREIRFLGKSLPSSPRSNDSLLRLYWAGEGQLSGRLDVPTVECSPVFVLPPLQIGGTDPDSAAQPAADQERVPAFEREKAMAGRDQMTTILGSEGTLFAAAIVGTIMNK